MGWYADTSWDLRFNSEEAAAEARKVLGKTLDNGLDFGFDTETPLDEIAFTLIGRMGEETGDNRFSFTVEDIDPLAIEGWTSGKCYLEDGHCEALAPYVTGTIDVVSDSGSHYRNRFFEGTWSGHDGEITYPDDRVDAPTITVWTCTVVTPDSPTPIATVHATEEACFESLRENYDPEDMADDEPPVAIVEHLEDEGYVINIDVHTVQR